MEKFKVNHVFNILNFDFSSLDSNEKFIVDTNILIFMFYSRTTTFYNQNLTNQKSLEYSDFISGLLSNGNKIVVPTSTLTELYQKIETTEFELKRTLYKNKKQYRSNLSERSLCGQQIDSIKKQIDGIGSDKLEVQLMDLNLERFKNDFVNHSLDTFDFCMLSSAVDSKLYNIITDDCDFMCCSNINVYTCSHNASKATAISYCI